MPNKPVRQLAIIGLALLASGGCSKPASEPGYEPSAAHRELASEIRELLAHAKPLDLTGDSPVDAAGESDETPDTPLAYAKPIIQLASDGLWYDLGFVTLDGDDYVFDKPGGDKYDEFGGGDEPEKLMYEPSAVPNLLAGDLSSVSFPEPAYEPDPGVDELQRITVKPRLRRSNPLYYPIKAQLTIEVLRKHCMNTPAELEAWTPVLAEIESIIARELAVIENQPLPPSEELGPDVLSRPYDEPRATLLDCDELIYRKVLGQLDRLARENNVILRRLDSILLTKFFSFVVKVVAEPLPDKLYWISDFRFKGLKRMGKEGDFSYWQEVEKNQAQAAGACHFVAVWKNNGQTQTSDLTTIKRIVGDDEVKLTP